MFTFPYNTIEREIFCLLFQQGEALKHVIFFVNHLSKLISAIHLMDWIGIGLGLDLHKQCIQNVAHRSNPSRTSTPSFKVHLISPCAKLFMRLHWAFEFAHRKAAFVRGQFQVLSHVFFCFSFRCSIVAFAPFGG